MTAAIIPFPASTAVLAGVPVPVVTIGWHRSLPKGKPYKTSVRLIEGAAGWAVESSTIPKAALPSWGSFVMRQPLGRQRKRSPAILAGMRSAIVASPRPAQLVSGGMS